VPHRANRKFVSNADALTAWTPLAVEALRETALTYNATVSGEELARVVQERSGITADQPAEAWIGKLLERVAKQTERLGEAPLAALCPGPDDDRQAAIDRLTCYRAHALDLPADGGEVAAVRRVAPPRRAAPVRTARTPRAAAPVVPTLRETTCTSCFMIVAVRDTCSSCGAALTA